MASSVAITETEILEALAVAAKGSTPADAKTVTEMMDETGLSRQKVTQAMRMLHKAGRLTVYEVRRLSFDGRNRPVPAYTILPAKKR